MIERIETILCPVDFSDGSALALQYAGALATHCNASLVVYHCVPGHTHTSPETMKHKHIHQDLGKFAAENLPLPLEARHVIEIGEEPGAGILLRAKQRKADLIVMGTHGFRGQERIFRGSVTNDVLHGSPVPVLTVGKTMRNVVHKHAGEQLQIKRILCAVDPNYSNIRMVKMALSLARSFQSTVLFLEVETYSGQESSLESLRSMIQPEREDWCKVEFSRRIGDPAEELLSAVKTMEIDLMMLGHYSCRFPEVLDNVALRVVPQASCPVLVLPFQQRTARVKCEEFQYAVSAV